MCKAICLIDNNGDSDSQGLFRFKLCRSLDIVYRLQSPSFNTMLGNFLCKELTLCGTVKSDEGYK